MGRAGSLSGPGARHFFIMFRDALDFAITVAVALSILALAVVIAVQGFLSL